VEVMSGCWQLS